MLTSRTALTELQQARKASGVTLQAIADHFEMDVGTWSRKLRGELPLTLDEVDKLAKFTRQPIRLSFGRKQKAAPPPEWVKELKVALAAVLQDRGISPDDAVELSDAWAVLERARRQQSPALDAVLLDPDA